MEQALTTEGLDLAELWQLLRSLRSRDCFCAAESRDMLEAFERYDKEKNSEISVVEAGKVLRWLGYTPTFEVQQSLVKRVDADASGMLGFFEFRKMVRLLQSRESEAVYEAFRKHDVHRKGLLPQAKAITALWDAGCLDIRSEVTPEFAQEDLTTGADGKVEVSIDSFIRIATRFQKAARLAFRDNSGFSPQEIQEMKECFAYYDADGSGDVSAKETVMLIEDLFPAMAHDPAMRPQLSKLMQGCDSLKFQDFLRLMQQLQELKMQERLSKEALAFEEAKFSTKEVEEFRDLFLPKDEPKEAGDEHMSFTRLQKMLGNTFPLGDKNVAELTALVKDVTGRTQGFHGETVPSLDFPEFLRLMRRLLDVNFAGMQEVIAVETEKPDKDKSDAV